MPKKNRIVPPGCVLHIVNRGNDKKIIFPEPLDYASFLVLLREARERFGVDLYAYCLMPNHFHLVVRTTGLEQISAYMHFVNVNMLAIFVAVGAPRVTVTCSNGGTGAASSRAMVI